jgi:hypothetical protein
MGNRLPETSEEKPFKISGHFIRTFLTITKCIMAARAHAEPSMIFDYATTRAGNLQLSLDGDAKNLSTVKAIEAANFSALLARAQNLVGPPLALPISRQEPCLARP